MIRRRVFGFGVLCLTLSAAVCAEDWNQFRGPQGTGVCVEEDVPVKWDGETNIRWRAPLPGPGNSSPIVSADRVFITVAADDGKQRSLHCYNRSDGRRLWTRTVRFDQKALTHKTNPYCASTPCADGRRVVVWHSSAGLYCYDYSGEELWSRDLGRFVHIWGYAASPIIYQNCVILNCGPGERTFLIALDKDSGRTIWKQDEPGGVSGLVGKRNWIGSWSTPIIAEVDGADQVLVSYPKRVKAYDPLSGEVLWQCEGLSVLVYTMVVMCDGVGVSIADEWGGPSIAFKLGGRGDVTETNRLWAKKRTMEVGSGIILGAHMWTVDGKAGIVRCVQIRTGNELWKARCPGGPAWGSLIYAGGRLYVATKRGDIVVFKPALDKLEVVAINNLGESCNSTPAISDGQIFLRTDKALYCIDER